MSTLQKHVNNVKCRSHIELSYQQDTGARLVHSPARAWRKAYHAFITGGRTRTRHGILQGYASQWSGPQLQCILGSVPEDPSCEWHVDSLPPDHVCKWTPHPFCYGPTASTVIVTKAGRHWEGLRVQNKQGWQKTCISWEQQQCGGKRSLFRELIRLHNVPFYFLLSRGRNSGGNLFIPICSNRVFECRVL